LYNRSVNNNALGRPGKKVVVARLEAILQNLPGKTEESHGINWRQQDFGQRF
jgi:hypothetical protein